MKIVWSPSAEDDLNNIFDYIASDNIQSALKMYRLFKDAIENLAYFPNKGRVGRCTGTRELVVHVNYIIVYCIRDNTIYVLNIVHAAKRYPV